MFKDYRVTSPFGTRISPISGKQEWHTGIDLVKADKSPIYAFVAGVVTHAKFGATGSGFGGYGNTVAIHDTTTGHLHVYAHLDTCLVNVGDKVERGQVIGRQGNTGQSTGSHLHYEIRKTHTPQYGWIADRANNCFEPTQYLTDYYKVEDKPIKQELTLEQRIEQLERKQSMPVPNWAKAAVDAAVKAKLIDTPDGGSYDFYRVLTILHRSGRI